MPSQNAVVRHGGHRDSEQGKHQPDERGHIFEEHDWQFRHLRSSNELRPAAIPFERPRFGYRGPQRERFEDDRQREYGERDDGRLERVRVQYLLDALVQGKQSARRKQDQGDENPYT